MTDTNPVYAEKSAAGWTTSLSPPSIDTKTDIYVDDFSQRPNWEGRPWAETLDSSIDDPVYELFYIKRVRVEMPDGSAVEFRKDDAKHPHGNTQFPKLEGGEDLLGTFLAVDGSRMRLEIIAQMIHHEFMTPRTE